VRFFPARCHCRWWKSKVAIFFWAQPQNSSWFKNMFTMFSPGSRRIKCFHVLYENIGVSKLHMCMFYLR
jgi:hypothetical protein